MSQKAHCTAGKWSIRPDCPTDILKPSGELLATFYQGVRPDGSPDPDGLAEAEANACLGAVAPELFDELEALVDQAMDACGAVSEYCAMPGPSLRNKLPVAVVRLKNRSDKAKVVLAKATCNESGARNGAPGLMEALKPFAEAYKTWSGGNAMEHFARAISPADFRRAAEAFAKAEPGA